MMLEKRHKDTQVRDACLEEFGNNGVKVNKNLVRAAVASNLLYFTKKICHIALFIYFLSQSLVPVTATRECEKDG